MTVDCLAIADDQIHEIRALNRGIIDDFGLDVLEDVRDEQLEFFSEDWP